MNAVECLQLHRKRALLTQQEIRTENEQKNMDVRGMSATDENLLYFVDTFNRSVKRVTLQTREVKTVYRSEWECRNVLQIEDGKSLILLEANPANEGI